MKHLDGGSKLIDLIMRLCGEQEEGSGENSSSGGLGFYQVHCEFIEKTASELVAGHSLLRKAAGMIR